MNVSGPNPGIRILGLLCVLKGKRTADDPIYSIERREGNDSWIEVSRFGLMEEAATALDELIAETGDDAGDYRISEIVERHPRRSR